MRLPIPFENCSLLTPEQLTVVALTRAITAIICCVILLIVLAVLMILAKWYFQRVCGTTVKRKGDQQEIKVAVFHGRKVPVISMNDFFAPAVWVCGCAFITFWDIFLVEDSFGCDPRLDCFLGKIITVSYSATVKEKLLSQILKYHYDVPTHRQDLVSPMSMVTQNQSLHYLEPRVSPLLMH